MFVFNAISHAAEVIARPKLAGPGEHFGIQLPGGQVLHLTQDRGIVLETYAEFAAGKDVRTEWAVPITEYQNVLWRAHHEMKRQQPYDLIENNCETFANRIAGREPKSAQVRFWSVVALGVGLAALSMNG